MEYKMSFFTGDNEMLVRDEPFKRVKPEKKELTTKEWLIHYMKEEVVIIQKDGLGDRRPSKCVSNVIKANAGEEYRIFTLKGKGNRKLAFGRNNLTQTRYIGVKVSDVIKWLEATIKEFENIDEGKFNEKNGEFEVVYYKKKEDEWFTFHDNEPIKKKK